MESKRTKKVITTLSQIWKSGERTSKQGGNQNEKCRVCKGTIVEIEGVVVKEVPAEVCSRCGEQYFDASTVTFVQSVANFVKQKKSELSTGLVPA